MENGIITTFTILTSLAWFACAYQIIKHSPERDKRTNTGLFLIMVLGLAGIINLIF